MQARRAGVPSAVAQAYAELKRRYAFPLSLKRIKGRYYLYKQLIKWDPESKKYRCIEMRYLGSVSDQGGFRPRRTAEGAAGDIESATALIEARGGRVVMPEQRPRQRRPSVSELDAAILTELTMDARIQVSELARKLGVEEKRLGYRIKSLERSLGLEYRPKIIPEGLGYLFFIVFANFKGRRPDPDKLQAELKGFPAVQFAALASNSKYDLVMIIATINDFGSASEHSLPSTMRNIRMSPAVKDIEAEWYVSYFDVSKGFMPLSQRFLEERISESVWSKRRERRPSLVSRNEYATLLALNANGAESFRSIEVKNGMSDGSAKYSYDSLLERKILQGVTLCMNALPVLYNAILIGEIIDEGAYLPTRNEVYRIEVTDQPDSIVNRVPLVSNMGAPYGFVFMVPVFQDGDLEKLESEFYANVKGLKVSGMVLTKILCGTLPYNRFDNTKTYQYQRLMSKQNDSPNAKK